MSALTLLLELAALWVVGVLLTAALGRASAAMRELVWRGVCVAVLALPFLGGLVPRWQAAAAVQTTVVTEQVTLPAGTFAPLELGEFPALVRTPIVANDPAPVEAPPGRLPLSILWALGAGLVFWPWVAGWLALRRAWKQARPLEAGVWLRELEALSPRRSPQVALVQGVSVPMLWCSPLTGAARLALPLEAEHWPVARVRSVLLHELAHLQRADGRARLLSRLALAFSWPIPLAWWGYRRMQREAERACDDAALAAGTTAADYAEHLLEVALVARAEPRLAAVAPAMARRADLDDRIALVLDGSRRRRPPARLIVRSSGLLAALVALPLAAMGQEPLEAPPATADEPAQVLERGLDWLVAAQDQETGAWAGDIGFKLNNSYKTLGADLPHVGVTALAMEALLDGGAVPGEGARGQAVVRGARFLVSTMRTEPGYAQLAGTGMKSHGLALEVLARLLGITGDEDLRAAVTQAAQWTVENQNTKGGWRYRPYAQDSDILHTASLLRALESAAASGVEVPQSALDRARDHVATHRIDVAGGFGYQANPRARVTAATTAAGLSTLRASKGFPREFRRAALDRLPIRLEDVEASLGNNALVWHSRDQVGRALWLWTGDAKGRARWQAFRAGMREDLRKSQMPNGNWACDGGPGTAYATAVACRLLAR